MVDGAGRTFLRPGQIERQDVVQNMALAVDLVDA